MDLSNLRASLTSLNPVDVVRDAASPKSNKLDNIPKFEILPDEKPLADPTALQSKSATKPENEDLRKAFQDFVGQTLYSQMIGSMRSSTHGAAYFNGGQAEKIFQSQMDQMMSEKLSEASASKISDPMFKLFQLRRGQ